MPDSPIANTMTPAATWCQGQTNTCRVLCNADAAVNECTEVCLSSREYSQNWVALPSLELTFAEYCYSRTSNGNALAIRTARHPVFSTTGRPCHSTFAR